jgi:predicted Mrr-cat superfamily restriction endonuclease
MSQQAFVLRVAPGSVDMVPEALAAGQLIIGWANAEGLLEAALSWEEFREIISTEYYPDERNYRKAGAAAGHLWRFIRDMKPADLVVVPHGAEFYVAAVTGAATYERQCVPDDSAYRRQVRWLNGSRPIQRALAKSALISRMKTQGTCADATDLLSEIQECVEVSGRQEAPTFMSDLQSRLIREVLSEMQGGRIDSFGFERLIRVFLYSWVL